MRMIMPGALPFYIDKVGVTFPAKGAAAAALAVIMGGIIKAKKTPGKFIGKFLLTNAIRPIKKEGRCFTLSLEHVSQKYFIGFMTQNGIPHDDVPSIVLHNK